MAGKFQSDLFQGRRTFTHRTQGSEETGLGGEQWFDARPTASLYINSVGENSQDCRCFVWWRCMGARLSGVSDYRSLTTGHDDCVCVRVSVRDAAMSLYTVGSLRQDTTSGIRLWKFSMTHGRKKANISLTVATRKVSHAQEYKKIPIMLKFTTRGYRSTTTMHHSFHNTTSNAK